MRRYALSLVSIILVGCAASIPTAKEIGLEFISPGAPLYESFRTGEAGELFPTQESLNEMRAYAKGKGTTLKAVISMQYGVHPHLVMAFLEKSEKIDVIATWIFWGRIGNRFHATISPSVLDSLQTLSQDFGCSAESLHGYLIGSNYVWWNGERQITCTTWSSDSLHPFYQTLQSVLDRFEETYHVSK